MKPIARSSDPITSHKAAAEFTASGRSEQCLQVLKLLSRYSNCTAKELSVYMWRDTDFRVAFHTAADAPRKRLNDLKNAGFAETGDGRKCTQGGKKAQTWHITPAGIRELENE